jgi:hypothetical protein
LRKHEEVPTKVDIYRLLEGTHIGVGDAAKVGVGGSAVDRDVKPAELLFDGLEGQVN